MKTYLLMGNPNVGKTTFYNQVTNSNNKISNYVGTTVDIYSSHIPGTDFDMIDIPGIRSLIAHSEDEAVAVKAFLEQDNAGLINIIDSSALKRNLLLSIQLLESGQPIHFVLNMQDELTKQGRKVNQEAFASFFGNNSLVQANEGLHTKDAIASIEKMNENTFHLDYDILEHTIKRLLPYIESNKDCTYAPRFYALQLLSKNKLILEMFDQKNQDEIVTIIADAEAYILKEELATSLTGYIFKVRRTYIQKAIDAIITIDESFQQNTTATNFIDKILLHPLLGSLIFLGVFYLIYYITFALGGIASSFLEEQLLVWIQEWLRQLLTTIQLPEFLVGLVVDGAYAGFATVVIFLPQIIIVFCLIAILEGTGYMSRSVIVFDKLLSRFGLNGRTLVPMVIGLGCSVPAIMAARTIPDKRERMTTQLVIPFISCAARLEIYVFFIAIFFTRHQALILMSINLLGAFVALLSAKILSSSIFKKKDSFFLVELPPYRKINFVYIYKITVNKIKQFLDNAAKFIVIGSIAVWLLLAIGPSGFVHDINDSFFALIGKLFAWAFVPLGFGTWQATSTLITGFLAKEMVVADLGVLVAGYPSIDAGMQALFTWQSALSFMVFNLLYIPCLSTVATMRAEMESWKWPLFSIGFSMVVAYIVSFIVYQGAMLFT